MDLKIFTKNIEKEAKEQIYKLLSLEPFKNSKVRIMPDVHAGKGCVIGFTADLGDKVIPNVVGVDIGCGMLTVELGKIDIDFEKLDTIIHEKIPAGMNVHENPDEESYSSFINELFCVSSLKNLSHIYASVGTLGGGNHFIEIDQDKEGNKYLIIHSGSRNLGKQVAEIYQQLAIDTLAGKDNYKDKVKEKINKYKVEGRQCEIQTMIEKFREFFKKQQPSIPKELCYLEGENREKYLHDMKICQDFAELNRNKIAMTICQEMGFSIKGMFQTVHNYISFEDNIVRKGAISAYREQKILIPINMRDGCIIATGKGNEDWNQSAPHGAGRIMSRTAAKQKIKLEDYKKSMEGIYSTTVNETTIDESPFAYKSIQEIIASTKDTINIEKIIKPIYNFKASE